MYIERTVDELTKEEWGFCFVDNTIYLNSYRLLKRENTRKRNYKAKFFYDRLSQRHSNITDSEAPLPEEIKKEAFEKFTSKIFVKKWSERRM